MPANRNSRGVNSTGSVRSSRPRRDSCASNSSLPDAGFRPTSPLRPTSPFGFSPYGTLTPGNSRPGSPFNKQHVSRNFRKSNSDRQLFTSILAPASPPLSADASESNSMELDPSTVTWECANALAENRKVQSFYEKPVYSEDGQIVSYGKVVTKTVTMTITTTIASTEILRPGEKGYEESVERYKKQQEEQQQKQQQQQPHSQNFEPQEVKFDKTFPEVFSPEETTNEERRDFFHQSARLQEQLRRAKYNSPSPSPPRSPIQHPTRQE
ncbi:hypothetical protein H072_2176 [Dactylellina haptotyla CBS 200.50]|uniref:Uncharacterized protein n=1 Tax=Dactylellina haptotyla (strain CBS 200.50) TaxID=1284197 RepID=S8BWW5_DACHA|nr:hypothetical protein H072_2176 [Dactylellina haptotyla CBS 200.50]